MRRNLSLIFPLLLLLALPQAGGLSQTRGPSGGGPLERAEAEARLIEVLQEIDRLKGRLESSRSAQRREQQQLKNFDLAIQQANRELRVLEEQQRAHLQELEGLRQQREAYLAQLDQRMDLLAEQIRWSYRNGRQSRIKLVLNQDDPLKLARLLAYYDYYAAAQAERIALLREALTTLEAMRQSIDAKLLQIELLTAEQRELIDQLSGHRQERQSLLARLARQIASEGSRLSELERDQKDLESLLARLSDVLADIPADLGDHVGVERQKGRLRMPVRGPVRHAFGHSRGAGLSWQGWLIGADAGAEVAAVAYGRVAFADWLRGYGLLMIIDHGQGYMSLYGNNESLLQEVGAWVEPGQTVSVVGLNPGSGQGLYFELRRDGKAIDPAGWMAR